jgi:hypothetical protein
MLRCRSRIELSLCQIRSVSVCTASDTSTTEQEESITVECSPFRGRLVRSVLFLQHVGGIRGFLS